MCSTRFLVFSHFERSLAITSENSIARLPDGQAVRITVKDDEIDVGFVVTVIRCIRIIDRMPRGGNVPACATLITT
jgi:hypothetical protein